jgi:hypothetical protein
MTLNLRDPQSIRAWLAVCPDRHKPQLRWMWKTWPEFRGSIEQAINAEKR